MSRKFICALACAALLAGCGSPSPGYYAEQQPVLDLKAYFNGPMTAHGMFQDRSGKVVKRFVVSMQGTWKGDTGILDEKFAYSDGTTQQRTWTIRQTGPGAYRATAPDVVGEAVGVAAGNALQWSYVLALPVDGKVVNVSMDDWMFLVDGRVMLNRTRMSKFGVHLGDVTLSIARP